MGAQEGPVKRVTQREVAALAGVSRATVSYVLNGSAQGRVPISPETQRRVLEAVSTLGYQPDSSAQTLRSGKTRIIGVLVPDLTNPHFWQILAGIEREGHRYGYTMLLFHTGLMKSAEDIGLRELARKRIDGLVLISSFPPSWSEATRSLTDHHLPVVDLSNVETPFDRILSDYREGAKELMEYLIGLGHRTIAFIYGAASPEVGLDRLEPYEAALRAHGIPVDPAFIIRCGTTIEEGYDAANRLFDGPVFPTAIVAINDLIALAVLRAAADRGISVPKELSIAGFDDIPFSKLVSPSLTSVHRDSEQSGEIAFRMLLDRMEHPEMPPRSERLETRLIVRESTREPPPLRR
jgi:LacI family transcriptional regulator